MDTYVFLIVNLFNRLSMLFMFTFVVSQLKVSKDLVYRHPDSLKDKIVLSMIFGAFGILGTYMSVEFNGALINTRIIGVAAGGILGGPVVGLMTGIIAGVHRFTMPTGLFTRIACGVSVPIEGIVAGLIGLKFKGKKNLWIYAGLTGAICESIRKISVLIFSKPFDQALELVKDIWFPMVLINSIGLAALFMIISNVYREREKVGAEQVNQSINIIDKILPYIREGFNSDSIDKVTDIIYRMTDFDAIAITDHEKVLSYSGIESKEILRVGSEITSYTKSVIDSGEMMLIDKRIEKDVFFQHNIIAPIRKGEEVIGTMKFYKLKAYMITPIDIEGCIGLSRLYSTQIRIGELEKQSQLVVQSELKALQAQINPHFLFNSLMVIASLCRTNSEKARELVLHLGNYFRKNISGNKKMIDISEEINHVKSYVEIEKARFEEKLQIHYEIDENLSIQLPPLTLQPIVENAIKHGILKKKNGGMVEISAKNNGPDSIITVYDNGIGIEKDHINELLNMNIESQSIGLTNVYQRLKYVYGDKIKFEITSVLGEWTQVTMEFKK
jgi:two-component system sensor histidine kinase LytS